MRAYVSIIVVGMLAISANGTLAQTQSTSDETGRTKKGAFSCLPVAAFQKISGDDGDVAINNFSIREAEVVDAPALTKVELSFSVANHSTAPYRIDSNVILTDGDENPLAAINASPLFDAIASGTTDTVKGSTLVSPGTLAKTVKICLRLFGMKQ